MTLTVLFSKPGMHVSKPKHGAHVAMIAMVIRLILPRVERTTRKKDAVRFRVPCFHIL